MAITPQQACEARRKAEQSAIEALEAHCDKALTEKFNGREPVWVPISGANLYVMEAVQRLYQDEGWKVEFHDDQREGSAFKFTTARIAEQEEAALR